MLDVEQDAGHYEDKFSNLRAGYTYMTGHPERSFCSWVRISGRSENGARRELDWYLLGTELNKKLQDYVRDLWHLYEKYPALSMRRTTIRTVSDGLMPMMRAAAFIVCPEV